MHRCHLQTLSPHFAKIGGGLQHDTLAFFQLACVSPFSGPRGRRVARRSPGQALTLLSENGPGFVSRASCEGALTFITLRVPSV